MVIESNLTEVWTDVFGRDAVAAQVYDTACQENSVSAGDLSIVALAGWLEKQSQALHGNEHRERGWHALAVQVIMEAGYW